MCEAIRWEQADGWEDVSSLKCVCVCAATLIVCSSPKAKIMDAIHYLRKVVASSRLIGGGSFWTKQCELWTLKPTKGD